LELKRIFKGFSCPYLRFKWSTFTTIYLFFHTFEYFQSGKCYRLWTPWLEWSLVWVVNDIISWEKVLNNLSRDGAKEIDDDLHFLTSGKSYTQWGKKIVFFVHFFLVLIKWPKLCMFLVFVIEGEKIMNSTHMRMR